MFQVIIESGVFETSDRLSLLRLQLGRRTVGAPYDTITVLYTRLSELSLLSE